MNKKQPQSGFAHLVVIVIISVSLLGALGFVFYQNFIQKDSVSNANIEQNGDVKTKTGGKTELPVAQINPVVSPVVLVTDFLTAYLTSVRTGNHSDVEFAANSPVVSDRFKAYMESLTVATSDHFLLVNGDTPSGFEVNTVVTDKDTANVEVALNGYMAGPHMISYNLVLVNNEWKIDSVTRL